MFGAFGIGARHAMRERARAVTLPVRKVTESELREAFEKDGMTPEKIDTQMKISRLFAQDAPGSTVVVGNEKLELVLPKKRRRRSTKGRA